MTADTLRADVPAQILVVDDEPDLRTLYQLTLQREGYRVESAATVADAWRQLEARAFDAVITDMRLPDGDGMELLHRLGAAQRSERCIVITAFGSAENAVEALKAGAFDYLTKPVDLKQFRAVVASLVRQPVAAAGSALAGALAVARSGGAHGVALPALARAPGPLASGAGTQTAGARAAEGEPALHPLAVAGDVALARMVGTSAAMLQVKARIAKVARGMAPVLVRGESGTGKELVARAVHACSQRHDGPFVAVNCGAIPENLLEAEFFGARKGSYTGSTQDRDGYFQAARGGTLFLDEIGDLPLAMQSKMLRAIQERSVRPIGATREDAVDVRIVSATHKDLQAEVRSGGFRQDLFYRLNVIEIAVPPLRERRGDLPQLCAALLARIALDGGMPAPTLSPEVFQQLAALPLDGNVRELENLLHRAVALNDGDALHLDLQGASESVMVDADTVPSALTPLRSPASGMTRGDADRPGALGSSAAISLAGGAARPDGDAVPSDLQAFLDDQERDVLLRALHETGFNRTAAAARLGLTLRQIRYRIARLRIAVPQGEDGAQASDG
ncbi:MAG: sigma-54 dependent transcriptional regulator [Variovorax sp.]